MSNIIISGGSGQDAYWMTKYLLANTNHNIYLVVRQSTNGQNKNTDDFRNEDRVDWVNCDLCDSTCIDNLIKTFQPDYFINFAAMSFVQASWEIPIYTFEINAVSVIKILEAIKNYKPDCRFYQAGSSEEWGDVVYSPQDEKHPARARSIYGASKIAARQICKVYRESYNMYCLAGWLTNHESEAKRDERFVSRKITKGVARIYHALKNNQPFEPIELGNLESKRDWSHSFDFSDGIWRILNQEKYNGKLIAQIWNNKEKKYESVINKNIKEYVLASGETHSIRNFIELAFKEAGIEIQDDNKSRVEPAYDDKGLQINYSYKNQPVVVVSRKFYRPAEVTLLQGDATLAKAELGWQPKISFNELVKRMVKYDIENYEQGK